MVTKRTPKNKAMTKTLNLVNSTPKTIATITRDIVIIAKEHHKSIRPVHPMSFYDSQM